MKKNGFSLEAWQMIRKTWLMLSSRCTAFPTSLWRPKSADDPAKCYVVHKRAHGQTLVGKMKCWWNGDGGELSLKSTRGCVRQGWGEKEGERQARPACTFDVRVFTVRHIDRTKRKRDGELERERGSWSNEEARCKQKREREGENGSLGVHPEGIEPILAAPVQ